MNEKKMLIIGLIVLLVGNIIFANLEDQIRENEAAKQALQDELKKINEQQSANKAEQTELEAEIYDINLEIQAIDDKINEILYQINATENAIAVKEEELSEALAREAEQNERMKNRLRTMYKAGSFSYLEILLGADDFSEMLTQVDKIQLLLKYDEETLAELIEIRRFIVETERQLAASKYQLVEMKKEEEVQRQAFSEKHDQLVAKQAELLNDAKTLENVEAQIISDADALTAVLKKQYAEKRAMQFAAQYQGGVMMWPLPLQYNKISSDFGWRTHPITRKKNFHTAIDLPAPQGTPIYAASEGIVINSRYLRGYGNAIMIDHGGGIITLYAHCSSLVAQLDQVVQRGDIVAKVGSTGWSTGPHLHFEVRKNGDYVDPKPYLRK